jgi:hypothetical protein
VLLYIRLLSSSVAARLFALQRGGSVLSCCYGKRECIGGTYFFFFFDTRIILTLSSTAKSGVFVFSAGILALLNKLIDRILRLFRYNRYTRTLKLFDLIGLLTLAFQESWRCSKLVKYPLKPFN